MARSKCRVRDARRTADPGEPTHRLLQLALFPAFALVALFVYRGAMDGPFLSDDVPYITGNRYVQELSLENLTVILDPVGRAIPLTANYSPVHLLLHAVEWQVFGRDVRGWHLVNVLLHALGSALLALLLLRSGLPATAAVGGAAFFLLHPANVEAVAWISQLKTTSAFVLVLGALLAHPRRPLVATALFALAILAKPLAAFALPVALLRDWAGDRPRYAWLGGWAAAFALLTLFEVLAFREYAVSGDPLHGDPWVWARTSFALAARYLAMAATSYGVSTFHELPLSLSWLDPWWLAGLIASVLLAWRSIAALRRRRGEAAWWVWAAVSFAPVAQLFPFDFGMADRYLYLILPGLIGGVLLAVREEYGTALAAMIQRPAIRAAALLLAAAVGVGFAAHSGRRAAIWRSAGLILADSISHYPQGRLAQLGAARRAVEVGDGQALARHLRAAIDAGSRSLPQLLNEFGGARTHPAVDAVFRDLASTRIERLAELEAPNQTELNVLALAYEVRGEIEPALAALERARAMGGPDAPLFDVRIAELRRQARSGAPGR